MITQIGAAIAATMAAVVNVLFHAPVSMVNERPNTEFGLIRVTVSLDI
jgi:hypothetical protein